MRRLALSLGCPVLFERARVVPPRVLARRVVRAGNIAFMPIPELTER